MGAGALLRDGTSHTALLAKFQLLAVQFIQVIRKDVGVLFFGLGPFQGFAAVVEAGSPCLHAAGARAIVAADQWESEAVWEDRNSTIGRSYNAVCRGGGGTT